MRNLFLILAAASSLAAQTTTFPTAVDTDASMFVTGDNLQTFLTSPMLATDNVAIVQNSAGFTVNMVATICDSTVNVVSGVTKCGSWEHMKITAVNGNILTVARAQAGTAAAAHASGKLVSILIDSAHHKVLKDAVIAIENVLGPNGSNLPTTPLTSSANYTFAPQTCSSSGACIAGGVSGLNLIAGNNTLTMMPVPAGVNGSDTLHRLYVSGGSGTAEGCLITGGSGTAGAASGTIILNCANAHSGAWTVQSATGGIFEAATALHGFGTVWLPKSGVNILATMVLPSAISLRGQGFSTTGPTGSVLNCASVSPCLVIADAHGSADGQGFGIHSDYFLQGPDTGATYGMWIGGDPLSGFAPSGWFGSYVRTHNIQVSGFKYALTVENANFVAFHDSVFAGSSSISGARALYIPSTASVLGMQPIEFHGCLLSVLTGNAVQMDYSGFQTSSLQYFGGQVSGTISGSALDWHSFGTHYEPNSNNDPLVTSTNGGTFQAIGGLMSTHGPSTPYHVSISGGVPVVALKDITVQCDAATTVPVWATIASDLGARVAIEDIHFQFAGTFTAPYALSGAALNTFDLFLNLNLYNGRQQVAAAGTLPFGLGNFPRRGVTQVTGATTTITAVSGLLAHQHGVLETVNPQTFTAGATIGNTVTTAAGQPYAYYFDGTKLWIGGGPQVVSPAGTGQPNAHSVMGVCTLGTNCAVTFTGSAAFTGASYYVCLATDNSAAAAVKVTYLSGTAATFTGTGTDVISYLCVGN